MFFSFYFFLFSFVVIPIKWSPLILFFIIKILFQMSRIFFVKIIRNADDDTSNVKMDILTSLYTLARIDLGE
jgi:hypothetical protein